MAMMDWNGDGKKDGFDNMIEYQIYKDSTKHSSSSHSSGNMSTLGAILCVIGGLVVTAMLFSETDVEDVPGILLAIVWIGASVVIAAIVGAAKR